jgi:tetratricopeptide (TPR) repeat protein
MKKTIIRNFILAVALLVGGISAQAQEYYKVPALSSKNAALAKVVVEEQFNDPDKANEAFMKLLKQIKKNKEQALSVGDYFLNNENYAAASQCAKLLETIDPTGIDALMFRGQVYMASKSYGQAGQCFDQVLAIDPNYIPALKRNAHVYKNVNPYVAIEALNKIKEMEPDYYKASQDLGDIYYKMNKNKEAVEYYSAYYNAVPKDLQNLNIASCENYMMALFSQLDFAKVKEVSFAIDELVLREGGKSGRMVQRMKFISSYETARNSINFTEELPKVEPYLAYITNEEYHDSVYLYVDYAYAAAYMKDVNNLEGAIKYNELAYKKDPTKVTLLDDIARLYRQTKQYDQAIEAAKKYLELGGDKIKLADHLRLGQTYVFAAQQDSLTAEKRAEYVTAGEAVLVDVLAKDPTAYQAALYRARINITDPNAAEEKPRMYYEESLSLMEGREGIETAQVEAYRYLAFYWLKKEDYKKCRSYVNKLLGVDANNSFGKKLDAALKKNGL